MLVSTCKIATVCIILYIIYIYSPIYAGPEWYDCDSCRCYQSTKYEYMIAKCIRTDDPSKHILTSIPQGLNKDTRELIITEHDIKVLQDNNFEYLSYLEILDLSKNNISTIKSHVFKNLLNLTDLDLSMNEITTLPTSIFQHTPRITRIYLQHNKLIVLQKNLFYRLVFLKQIYVQNNELLTVQENCFSNALALTEVNFSHNKLTHISIKIFTNVQKIKKVNLAYNPWNCDNDLCEIMNITVSQSWDQQSYPVCHDPKNKHGIAWREVINSNKPTITSSVTESATKRNVTLQCNVCSISEIVWRNDQQTIFENVVKETDKYSTISVLTLNQVSINNNGVYSCQVTSCKTCAEDTVYINEESTKIISNPSTTTLLAADESTSTTISPSYETTKSGSTTQVTEQQPTVTGITSDNNEYIVTESSTENITFGKDTFITLLILVIIVIVTLIIALVCCPKRETQKVKNTIGLLQTGGGETSTRDITLGN